MFCLKIKHFSIVFISLFIVGSLCASYFYVLAESHDYNISIKTDFGSEEVLKDITVKGDIGDEFHKVSFSIQNGTVQTEFVYGNKDYKSLYNYENPSDMCNFDNDYPFFSIPSKELIQLQTETMEYYILDFDIYVSARKNQKSGKFEWVDNKVVYTVEKKDLSDEIRYMGKVGEKLVVIVSRSGYLFADIIDPVQRKLLCEFKIDALSGELRNDSIDSFVTKYYDSAESNGYFILRQSEYFDSKPYYRFYVMDIDNCKVLENILISKLEMYNISKYYTKVLYKNGIFYVLVHCQQSSGRVLNFYPVKIYAYRDGKKLYEGHLITGIEDDILYDREIYPASIRSYYNMRME